MQVFKLLIKKLFAHLSIDQPKLNWLIEDKSIIQRLLQILNWLIIYKCQLCKILINRFCIY